MNITDSKHFSTLQGSRPLSLVAQVMAITHHVQRETLGTLTTDKGYRKLSLNFARYVSALAEGDIPPGELAEKLAVSKQACSKTLRELESLGLITRRSNPQDGRSSLVSLTDHGRQLVRDGTAANVRIQQKFASAIGSGSLAQLVDELETVCRGLDIALPSFDALVSAQGHSPSRLNVLLYSLNNYCYQHLIDDLAAKGFKALKSNYSQVLGLIGPDGGRIQTIASLAGVSKQAIAALAAELEQLGYIRRETDPGDRRQVVLWLSESGERLLDASATSVERLLAAIEGTLDEKAGDHLQQAIGVLYQQADHQDQAVNIEPGELETLCRQLVEQLGARGARALAQHLWASTREVA